MAYYIKLYVATLIAFFTIDIIWLSLVARTFYRKYLGLFSDGSQPKPGLLWQHFFICYS